jgi:hypothetical protein
MLEVGEQKAESFNAEGWHTTRIQNLIDNLYNDREIALNKLLKIKNAKLQKLLSSNKLLKDRVGGLSLAQWAEVQAQLKYTPSGRIRTFGAESFEASERGNLYWCDECGKYMGCESYGNWPSKMIITETEQELCGACYKKTQNAESFRSYKVAPDLSSYTKAELVSSIAGPQGTAAYDEVVYDPIAQSRLSAETSTQRFKNYGNSLSGDTVCPACGDESWDEYLDGDEWRGYCGCGYDFDVGSALPNPLLTFYEMEALKEQGKLTSDQKEYLEWRITSTLSDLESSSHNKKYIQDELVAHGWTLDRWGNVQPPEESASTLVGNAESIDSFSPARLIILGASIGVALGLYKTRGE